MINNIVLNQINCAFRYVVSRIYMCMCAIIFTVSFFYRNFYSDFKAIFVFSADFFSLLTFRFSIVCMHSRLSLHTISHWRRFRNHLQNRTTHNRNVMLNTIPPTHTQHTEWIYIFLRCLFLSSNLYGEKDNDEEK